MRLLHPSCSLVLQCSSAQHACLKSPKRLEVIVLPGGCPLSPRRLKVIEAFWHHCNVVASGQGPRVTLAAPTVPSSAHVQRARHLFITEKLAIADKG